MPITVDMVDLDGDGALDLAATTEGSFAVDVFPNTTAAAATTPTFAARIDVPTGTLAVFAAFGDLDGDAKPDIVLAGQFSTLSVVLNTTTFPGSPSFGAATLTPTGSNTMPIGVALADFDGDGRRDVALAAVTAAAVFLDTTAAASTPTFAPKDDVGANARAVALADIEGDGKLDLVIAHADANISVLLTR